MHQENPCTLPTVCASLATLGLLNVAEASETTEKISCQSDHNKTPLTSVTEAPGNEQHSKWREMAAKKNQQAKSCDVEKGELSIVHWTQQKMLQYLWHKRPECAPGLTNRRPWPYRTGLLCHSSLQDGGKQQKARLPQCANGSSFGETGCLGCIGINAGWLHVLVYIQHI